MDLFIISKILAFAVASFLFTFLLTPSLTYFLYRYKLGKNIRESVDAPIYTQLHQKKKGTPTMGGILIWLTLLILILAIFILSQIFRGGIWEKLNFLSRTQTYLPLGMFLFAAILGLIDDLLGVLKIGVNGGGLKIKYKLIIYTLIAIVGAWWFHFKLGWSEIHIPFFGDFDLGIWYVVVFVFIVVATTFSVNESDGLDGLAGGILLPAFVALTLISFVQGKYDLAVFNSVLMGSLVGFLWFNIYPARFFMGDTGSMSLGIVLGVMAMLTNTAFLLPFFGFILVVESLSVIFQMISKKIFHKKIFLSTPIHHHFEAIGWPETKVTMRFWIIANISTIVGLILFFIDRGLR